MPFGEHVRDPVSEVQSAPRHMGDLAALPQLGCHMSFWKIGGVDGKVSLSRCTSVSTPPPPATGFLN